MKILVVGGGGREHALCWALARSPRVTQVCCAPGNAGIANDATPVPIGAEDVDALVAHVESEGYDLVVVGPEAPLVEGLADRLAGSGVRVFGPSAAAARMEGSKAFAKEFMARHGIPTGAFRVFDAFEPLRAALSDPGLAYPVVLKADGLAAGKGVLILEDRDAAIAAAREMLVDDRFGSAGRRVVLEEMLRGREVSFFVLSDGSRVVELATCQDYKRALDADEGLNTGGMGTYSPSAYLDDATRRKIVDTIVRPTIDGMAADGFPYRGVLFIGLMLTDDGPKVLEYNCRFGDPETQVLLPRLDGDWAELLTACADGTLDAARIAWRPEAAVCVVMASEGYPSSYPKGVTIEGVETAGAMEDVVVFHAGTSRTDDGTLTTAGGRVLGVTALGADLESARARAYEAVNRIHWNGEHHRTDIARDAVPTRT